MKTDSELRLILPVLVPMLTLLIAYGSTHSIIVASSPSEQDQPDLEFLATLSSPKDSSPEPSDLANCRFGVAAWGTQVAWVDDFHAGWYIDFAVWAPPATNSAEYVPVIRIKQRQQPPGNYLPTYDVSPPLSDVDLGAQIDARPGALWIVGNEVDRVEVQDDTFPDVYATAYHEIYHYIKQRDPSATVSNSGLVEVTPGRIQYMDLMWDAYVEQFGKPMPVDVWNMHIYILPEKRADGHGTQAWIALGTDPALAILESGGQQELCPRSDVYCMAEHDDLAIFSDQVVAMREWMKEHGQQHKPLILSEYSLLYPFEFDDGTCFRDEYGACFDPQRVSRFLEESVEYLENAVDQNLGYPPDDNRLVQQWLWFSTYIRDHPVPAGGSASNLVKKGLTEMTEVGQLFESIVSSRGAPVNLLIFPTAYPVAFTVAPGNTAEAVLTANVFNNGSVTTNGDVQVTFYADPDLTQVIGSDVVSYSGATGNDIPGCARAAGAASVIWSDLTTGIHSYWAKVDPADSIAESDENDNVVEGFVIVNPTQKFLPLVNR